MAKARSALNKVTAPEPAKSFVKFKLVDMGWEIPGQTGDDKEDAEEDCDGEYALMVSMT